jgi:hypothetical protein
MVDNLGTNDNSIPSRVPKLKKKKKTLKSLGIR